MYNNDNNYKFPSSFPPYLIPMGHRKADRYHGIRYRFAVTLQPIKQVKLRHKYQEFRTIVNRILTHFVSTIRNLFLAQHLWFSINWALSV